MAKITKKSRVNFNTNEWTGLEDYLIFKNRANTSNILSSNLFLHKGDTERNNRNLKGIGCYYVNYLHY